MLRQLILHSSSSVDSLVDSSSPKPRWLESRQLNRKLMTMSAATPKKSKRCQRGSFLSPNACTGNATSAMRNKAVAHPRWRRFELFVIAASRSSGDIFGFRVTLSRKTSISAANPKTTAKKMAIPIMSSLEIWNPYANFPPANTAHPIKTAIMIRCQLTSRFMPVLCAGANCCKQMGEGRSPTGCCRLPSYRRARSTRDKGDRQ